MKMDKIRRRFRQVLRILGQQNLYLKTKVRPLSSHNKKFAAFWMKGEKLVMRNLREQKRLEKKTNKK